MNKQLIRLFLCVAMIGIVLVGCGSTSNEEADQVLTSENSITYNSLTLDNYGREVFITEKPTKVLTLGPNATELFIALGLKDLVIGKSLDNHSRSPLPEYAEAYANIEELTYGSATREAVITSGADFIYGIDWEFGGEGLDIEELEEFGITTYMNSASSLEEIYEEILDLGKIFEVEDAAEAFVNDQKERIAIVQEKISDQDPVDVLVYDSGGDGVFTAGGTNFATILIECAGGKNIFDDITDKQWATVSFEEVLARDPDIILIQDYDAPPIKQKINEMKENSVLAELASVENENFVVNTLESVLPGNRMAYTVELLAEKFYPELFK